MKDERRRERKLSTVITSCPNSTLEIEGSDIEYEVGS